MYESSAEAMVDEAVIVKSFEDLYPESIQIDTLLEPKRASATSTVLIDPKPENFHENYVLKTGCAEGRDF